MVRLLAPFSAPPVHKLHFNRFDLVPDSEPGQWRMIIDLSFPSGFSVNDGIPDSEACYSRHLVPKSAMLVR